MQQSYTMKKKAPKKKNTFLNIIISIAFIILVILIIFKEDSQINKVSMGYTPPSSKGDDKDVPSQLKWFDNFKGIDNMNKGASKEKASNFMEYEKQKNNR